MNHRHSVAPRIWSRYWILVILVLSSALFHADSNADWPEYRGNRQRTAFVPQTLESAHWNSAWMSTSWGVPDPAWPAPARGSLWQKLDSIEPRVTDDRANVPLIVKDLDGHPHIIVTSSGDDRVGSFHPVTGELEWEYSMDAPIRYAPSTLEGVLYFGSDDGRVRAVDAKSGSEIWRTQLGPSLPWIVGNRRLISSHPIRTGVLAKTDLIYATAGLFPGQGVYLVALERTTGKLRWRRRIEKSPQGYLLASGEDRIYIPTGRSVPFAIDASDGEQLFELPSPGGSFCMLTAEAFFAGPGNDASVNAKPVAKKSQMLSFKGRKVAAGVGKIWTANGSKLVCLEMDAIARGDMEPVWQVDSALDEDLVVSGSNGNWKLFVAGENRVEVYDAISGVKLVTLKIPIDSDTIQSLAVSESHLRIPELLVATTRKGNVIAWHGGSRETNRSWDGDALKNEFHKEPTFQPNTSPQELKTVSSILEFLPVRTGLALIIQDGSGGVTEAIRKNSSFHCLVLLSDSTKAERLRDYYRRKHEYGRRVVVWDWQANEQLPFSRELFNVVIEAKPSGLGAASLREMLTPSVGVLSTCESERLFKSELPRTAGVWRHQYGDLANRADSQDEDVSSADEFRLQWFGGVGPNRMPDRHLRGPAPLVAGGAMVMQGDGVLIGVDPFNGTERWQYELPKGAMRYVTPFDGGYACLTPEGDQLFVAASKKILKLNALTGKKLASISVPKSEKGLHWGYLVESYGEQIASLMKPSAARTSQEKETRYSFVNSDYRSDRPLVCSRVLVRLASDGNVIWAHKPQGVLIHGSLSVESQLGRAIFVEARSARCRKHATDRIFMKHLMESAFLVCLDSSTGTMLWERRLEWPNAKNMLYSQLAKDKVVLATSESKEGVANYAIRTYRLSTGELIWENGHRHVKKGLFHGEQVHHPVVLTRPNGSRILVCEPYFYDLNNGNRMVPEGAPEDWALRRPGHSCGTLSAAGNCLFFRASNPTVLNLGVPGGSAFTRLAPTRAGCWINMIPASGRLLIPEGSASCVCNYSLQTSMGFLPISSREQNVDWELPDVLPEKRSDDGSGEQ